MTRDLFTATLRRHFGPDSFIEGAPPDPVAVFPAKHPEVGEVRVWLPSWAASSIGLMGHVRVAIGTQFLQQFENLDTDLDGEERSRRLTADIIRFLENCLRINCSCGEAFMIATSPNGESATARSRSSQSRSTTRNMHCICGPGRKGPGSSCRRF